MSEFFHMGGYASYVWFSYGITLVAMTISWVMPVIRHNSLLKKLKRRKELD